MNDENFPLSTRTAGVIGMVGWGVVGCEGNEKSRYAVRDGIRRRCRRRCRYRVYVYKRNNYNKIKFFRSTTEIRRAKTTVLFVLNRIQTALGRPVTVVSFSAVTQCTYAIPTWNRYLKGSDVVEINEQRKKVFCKRFKIVFESCKKPLLVTAGR